MTDSQPLYTCPDCSRGILNRRVDRCLYCGASLPPEMLLSSEQLAELNRQQAEVENGARRSQAGRTNAAQEEQGTDWGDVVETAIDIISDLGDLLD